MTAAENLKLGDRLRVGEIYTLFYREVESGFLFKGEQHSMFELTYVDRGALHCVVDGNGVELHQGQLMVFGPQQWHMQYTDLDMTARFLTVSFDLRASLPRGCRTGCSTCRPPRQLNCARSSASPKIWMPTAAILSAAISSCCFCPFCATRAAEKAPENAGWP